MVFNFLSIKKQVWKVVGVGIWLGLQGCYSSPTASVESQINAKNPNQRITVDAFLAAPLRREYLLGADSSYTNRNYQWQHSSIEYTNSGDLQAVALSDTGRWLNFGLEIGMPRSAFEARFVKLESREANPYILVDSSTIEFGCCQSGSQVWKFIFKNNHLSEITFSN